jgi:hypothetical protein
MSSICPSGGTQSQTGPQELIARQMEQSDCTEGGAIHWHGTVRICTATIGPHTIKTRKGKTHHHHHHHDDPGALLKCFKFDLILFLAKLAIVRKKQCFVLLWFFSIFSCCTKSGERI